MQAISLQGYALEIGLFALIAIVLGAVILRASGRLVSAISTAGLGVLLGASVLLPPGAEGGPDAFADFFQRLFLLVAVFVSIMAEDFRARLSRGAGEFHALLLFATAGLLFIARAEDFLTLFVSIELLTVSLFILAAFLPGDARSAEAGMKYVILGGVASAFLLYGIAFVYGYAGSLRFEDVAAAVAEYDGGRPGLSLGLTLILAGLAFKVAAVPFQFWVPDVYEGAPAPITAFLTVASKGAGFAALLRVLISVMGPLQGVWAGVIGILAAATLFYGNLGAIPQTNIKRLLGYSSIGQAGFILIGLAAASPAGTRAILFYLLAYAFTAMAAFLAVTAFSRSVRSDELRDYEGLWKRSPILAICLAVSFLSLAGFPPLSGFFGKFLLLMALLESPGMLWLAIIAGANVIISLYYYLGVIRRVYVSPPHDPSPIPVSLATKVAIGVALLGTILLGIYQGPFVTQAQGASWALY